jgi:hypothetical protein
MITPPTLQTQAGFGLDNGKPAPARGRAIVLLTASPCTEYPGTRCVMDVLHRPGWTREEAREKMSQLPDWTAPHYVMVSDPDEWLAPEPPGTPGEHTPFQKVRRRLRELLSDAEAEIGELRGEDDYTEQQAKAEAYALAIQLLDQEFGVTL